MGRSQWCRRSHTTMFASSRAKRRRQMGGRLVQEEPHRAVDSSRAKKRRQMGRSRWCRRSSTVTIVHDVSLSVSLSLS